MNLTELAVSIYESKSLPDGTHLTVIVSQENEETGQTSYGYASTIPQDNLRKYLRAFVKALFVRKATVH